MEENLLCCFFNTLGRELTKCASNIYNTIDIGDFASKKRKIIDDFVENDEKEHGMENGEQEMKNEKLLIRKKYIVWLCITVAAVLLVACDVRLKTVCYKIETEKIQSPVRIALLTDLHSCRYGKEQATLLKAIEKEKPDVILLSGDIFDDKMSYENAELTVRQLSERYPCYYVTGNHEYWGYDVETILDIVRSCDVTILSGNCATVEINGQMLNICGVDDPDVAKYVTGGVPMDQQLERAEKSAQEAGNEAYTILLSHRPELFEKYQMYAFDLVVCGHAHGGQWRIPGLLNGLYAPHQGIFPKYAGGRYDYEDGTMIVSRGLARESTLVPRIFNRPELVIVDIE